MNSPLAVKCDVEVSEGGITGERIWCAVGTEYNLRLGGGGKEVGSEGSEGEEGRMV